MMKRVFGLIAFVFSLPVSAQIENPYCLTLDNVNVELPCPRELPNTWTDPATGRTHYNMQYWPDENLRTIGWYPYVVTDNPPAQYSQFYDRSLSGYTINATTISQDVTYTQWDIDRVKDTQFNLLASTATQYSANEVAADKKISQRVTDELVWLNNQQVALIIEDDWNTVAGWDTSKPDPLPLPNSYVGQSYVNQGVALQAENTAATDAGQVAPWPSTVVSSFISDNEPAANDASNATAPVDPTFEIRQGIVKNSEASSRVMIYRTSTGDPNPALDTVYAMVLTNRALGDNRNLYIFSHTGACDSTPTYLTWRQFVLQPSGEWTLQGTPSEWQYSKGDMCFIFSYGTNFAVTADYFTDKVDYSADDTVKTIVVAWDKQ